MNWNDINPTYIISSLALVVALSSLGWNVYKELGLRPRVKVSVGVMELLFEESARTTRVRFSAVNYGPGAVYLTAVVAESRWLTRRRTGGSRFSNGVVFDRSPAGNDGLPMKLEVGQHAQFWMPYDVNSFLKSDWANVGLMDSFDRKHWAPRKKLDQAREQYRKDFGVTKKPGKTGSADSGREGLKA